MPYLNKDTIVNASKTINDTLLSRNYIDKPLLFNTINFDQLKVGQVEDLPELQVTEALYNNDKNIINLVHGLVQNIDKTKDQSTTFNKLLSRKDDTIKELESRNAQLLNKIQKLEDKHSQLKVDIDYLTKQNHSLDNTNKIQLVELNKLKLWNQDINKKYKLELKRKNLEIDNFKDQLLDKKSGSALNSYGVKLDENPNLIINNNPIIDNAYNSQQKLMVPILNNQYEKIVIDLTSLVDSLVQENGKFNKFFKLITNYLGVLNNQLHSTEVHQLPNPSEYISVSFDKIELNEIENFEYLVNPLLNNIYKNHHYLKDLIDKTKHDDIDKLKQELKTVTKNWESAMKTLDDWKSIR